MNDMELLWEVAQETPLPAPAELAAARARLVAAIATDPATYATAVAGATMSRPDPSSGRPVEPLRPPAPAPVLTAAKLMYGGAVGTAVQWIIGLAYIGDIKAYHLAVLRHQLTTAQLSQWRPLIITVVIALGLAEIALWLWVARAVGQGRNWARILSAVLVGLATLQLAGNNHVAQGFAVLTWLTGLAALWLLWRPAASAFFKSARVARSQPPSQISGP